MEGTAGHALYARFLRGLALSPDGVAVRVGAEEITYGDAHRLALLWAGALLREASGPPKAIGVLAARSVQAYVGILAGLYAGVTVVPLQPGFPAARTGQMIDAAGVSAVIVDDRGYALLPELADGGRDLRVLAPGRERADGAAWAEIRVDGRHALDGPRPVAPSDVAYVLFTSGSTGRPKGVTITHGNTDHYFRLLDARYDFTPGDVFSQVFDLNFDCAMFDLFCAWGAGATAVAVPPAAYRDMPSFLAEQGVTVWFSTPSAISLIRRMGGLGVRTLPGLRWSFFAGEALKCEDAADWELAAPGSVVENLYGPTELTITVSGHRWSAELSPKLGVNGVVPIGLVHEGHDHFLLTDDGEGEDGQEGELCVSGPQMTPGYLDPADNEGRFLRRGSRDWYRTGDRVRRTGDGELAYVGRLDAQVQVQGLRVELAEVDHALRACTGVEEAVTVGAPVSGGVELYAFYTGSSTPPAALARELRKILPAQMVPRHFRHILEMPLNSNRKIDRSALRGRAADLIEGAP
ncbi:amino acid adenylation domain-containing protein [Streptosporangium album]|uniref:Amino acid adenylation domain-containing protein n=1 Tax=Streptosporangium album TaxID=47479 RepID=A0A7W7S535_9ACTN|nr:AMP-binding protein [Streptosporangium album]MBB4944046.1 amino acid adenylation domain-containing protein [Streptosporangium album]